MALTQVGSAAGEAAPVVETIRRREVLAPQRLARHPDDDALLDAIRAGLAPGDPVARLLAGWTVVPAQAIATPGTRS
ncbi:MAG: hypothetical protein QOK35_327 [Pseudonocardiales bacterium]|jgi:hypothetical protein|nr:hypothetical protein [Pseudonocardiales bacterium]